MLPILLLFAAFGVGHPTAPAKPTFTAPARTACSLVSRADVQRALGRPVDDGAEETEGPASTCDYSSKDGIVSVALRRLPAKPDRQLEIAALSKELPEGSVRNAPGFPDAFYFDLPGAGTQLHIVSGGRVHLMISILGFGEPVEVSAAAERIARKALARL